MPNICFNYSSGVPRATCDPTLVPPDPRVTRRGARRTPGYPCFSYAADLPLSIRDHGATATGLPRRPAGKPQSCFSYQA